MNSPPAPAQPPLRLLLVDDEALARLRLRTLLAELPDVELAGEAADADAALTWLQARTPSGAEGGAPPVDALLLDIRMPGPSAHMGLRLARAIQALPQPPAVIFVTAHAEHALAAFELEALDYLTKPVRRDRLAAALKRLRERVALRREGAAPLPGLAPALVVSDRGRLLRVPLAEVLVLRAELKYVTLRTAERSHVLDESLTELEQRLRALGGPEAPGGPAFVRIHRNALVATHAVRELALRDGGSDASRGSGGGRGGSHDAGSDEAEDGDSAAGWAVRVAPLDEWLAVSRRQVPAVKAALAGRSGSAAGRGGAAP
jgi:two-component system, LytTR family, response regulator AlgR